MSDIPVTIAEVQALPFVSLNGRKALPKRSKGIYFVVAATTSPKVLYIGMTATSFYERWKNHHKTAELSKLASMGVAVNIHYMSVDTTENLASMESSLIGMFDPSLNDQILPSDCKEETGLKVKSFDEFMKDGFTRKWISPGFITERSLVLFCADYGTGKTYFAYNMILNASSGDPIVDIWGHENRIKTLLIQTDETESNSRYKMQQLNFDVFLIKENLDIVTDWSFEDIPLLEEWIARNSSEDNPCLVVMDSLTSCKQTEGSEENEAGFSNDLYRLRDLINKYNVSFFVLHHTAKYKNGRIPRGSSAIGAAATDVFVMYRTDEEDLSSNRRTIVATKYRNPVVPNIEFKFNQFFRHKETPEFIEYASAGNWKNTKPLRTSCNI